MEKECVNITLRKDGGYIGEFYIQYSGTVGAALEAAFQGCKGIAISEQDCGCHEVTGSFLHDLLAELLETRLLPDQILNVNIPGCKLSECNGILRNRTVSRSMFFPTATGRSPTSRKTACV